MGTAGLGDRGLQHPTTWHHHVHRADADRCEQHNGADGDLQHCLDTSPAIERACAVGLSKELHRKTVGGLSADRLDHFRLARDRDLRKYSV